MAINKVEYGGETLIDLTSDSVTPETLANGVTAHDASGAIIVGTATPVQLVQSTGSSEGAVMSQKAVTDAIEDATLQGERGTGILKVTTAPSSYTTAIGSYTPKYRIALSTVKTQSGVSEVLIGDIIMYSYYHYHVDYLDASYAYISATRVSIRGATGADGKDYVLTDADKDEIANLVTNSLSDIVSKSGISLGIASDGLMYVFVDGQPVGTGIPQGQSGDVFGYVDENNTIVLNGNLADGTYTVKYEMEDGSTIDVGNMVLDSNVYYSITKNLTNCSISNSAVQIVEGGSYTATITANSGYELSSLVVTMGGSAVTVTNGMVSIASVTGNIIITAVAEEEVIEIVNQIPLSTDTDGTIYNGIGYKTATRINSSGNAVAYNGASATGFIPAVTGDTVYLRDMYVNDGSGQTGIALYDSSKTFLGVKVYPTTGGYVSEGNDVYSHTISTEKVAYIRCSVLLTMDGSEIITVNQKIS